MTFRIRAANALDLQPLYEMAKLTGGGFKPGYAHGATDEFGHMAVQDKVHMHDLHDTILHQLGLDHKKLTYRFDGRNFRLTDVHGHVVRAAPTPPSRAPARVWSGRRLRRRR